VGGYQEVASVLESLFPAPVRVSVWYGELGSPALFPEESTAVENSVEKRRLEFARGRGCARRALSQLGVTAGAIPVGQGRSPVWPPGTVGSITHCDGLVAAAVAREPALRAVGLDVEVGGELDGHLITSVCTPREVAAIRAARPEEVGRWCKMLFSAKESVHKAIYPTTTTWLDFLDVHVSVDFAHRCFRVRPATDRAFPVTELEGLTGRYEFLDGYVATGVTLP
jgi:4'-phosphopantetheinyl transferase EntD